MTACDVCGGPAVIGGERGGQVFAHCRPCDEGYWRRKGDLELELAAMRAEVAAIPADQLQRQAQSAIDRCREAIARDDLEGALRLSMEHLYLCRRMRGVPLEG